MNPLKDVVDSRLDRVIAVGQTHESGGVLVELTAIEVRDAGAFLFVRARPVTELNLMSAEIRVTDDRGTEYETWFADHEGSALHWSGRTVFAPAPPPDSRLLVDVLSFGPPLGRPVPSGISSERIHGPWRFAVDV